MEVKHINKQNFKMRTIRIIVLFVIVLSITNVLNAQKQWTLEECIGYAFQNNITIKRQALQNEISANNLKQSKIDLFPDLGAGYGHSLGSGQGFDNSYKQVNKTSNGSANLSASVVLFSGMQKWNTIKMNQFNLQSSFQNLEKAKNDIALNIAAGYLQILFNKEIYEVAQNQLDVTKLQVDKTKKLFEVGNVAKGSLLDVQAQSAAEEASLIDAENNLKLSYLNLSQMLDLDTVKNFTIFIPTEVTVPESFNENTDSIYNIAIENLPQIKGAEFSLLRAKSQLAVSKGSRFPTLSLNAGIDTRYNMYDSIRTIVPAGNYAVNTQINDNLYKSVSLSLRIPIFTKYQIQRNINNSKIEVVDAEYSLRQSQLQLRKDIEQAYANAQASFQKFKANTESTLASEENFKYIQQKFDVGMINSVDFNLAKKNYTKAKSDLVSAKYDFIFKTKVLDFYKGNAIKL
jgi:outer membrane protein